ncbi:MAG: hypothetical protein DMG25_04070 [Acidobacteria bacterium]|nr:MAG: hypothetical protein DMG25_04070 [Acidobacteriota bacterium]
MRRLVSITRAAGLVLLAPAESAVTEAASSHGCTARQAFSVDVNARKRMSQAQRARWAKLKK